MTVAIFILEVFWEHAIKLSPFVLCADTKGEATKGLDVDLYAFFEAKAKG